MTTRTHIAAGAGCGVAVALTAGINPVHGVLLGMLGGVLPDADTALGRHRAVGPTKRALGLHHRGITHSFLGAFLMVFLFRHFLPRTDALWLAFGVGLLSHVFLDFLSGKVKLLFPLPFRIGLEGWWRPGHPVEELLRVAAALAVVFYASPEPGFIVRRFFVETFYEFRSSFLKDIEEHAGDWFLLLLDGVIPTILGIGVMAFWFGLLIFSPAYLAWMVDENAERRARHSLSLLPDGQNQLPPH